MMPYLVGRLLRNAQNDGVDHEADHNYDVYLAIFIGCEVEILGMGLDSVSSLGKVRAVEEYQGRVVALLRNQLIYLNERSAPFTLHFLSVGSPTYDT
jgi:hypothetical protein